MCGHDRRPRHPAAFSRRAWRAHAAHAPLPALVHQLTQPSPKRHNGTHLAQPVLCRAGPGTGKTWMFTQALFLLAASLSVPA